MRKLYLICTLLLTILVSSISFAQDFSNKGKEFWLAYSYHVGMVNTGGAPAMTLYITSDVTTNFTVEIFGGSIIQSGTITANGVVPVVIPNTYFINNDGLFTGKTIHVTGVKPIVVYSFITRSQASAASLCLPTNVLGKEYYAASFTQISNEANASSFITIVAVEDNTTVQISPTANTKGGWLAGSVHTVNLNKGEVYQVLGTTTGNNGVDLSGTNVKSIASGTGGCKRIAVFSGSGKLSISAPTCTGSSADNLYQQLYPVASWGKKYLTAPSYARPSNHYRIMRSDPATNVYLNGALIPSASFTNNYYQFYNNTPNLIESDIPVSVAQYFTSQGCPATNPSPYDPDMIVLNPVEQNINKVTLVSSPLTATGAQQHHLHVVMRNTGTGQSSFTFDGASVPASSWVVHPQDPNYSYLYLANVAQGNHTLYSDSGFNAVAYGYGNAETYGYSAGANVKDIYQYVTIQNPYATVNFPATCLGTPFHFSMTFPYQPTQIQWIFGSILNGYGIPDQTITNGGLPIVPTSTTIVNGKTLYIYQLPLTYTIPTTGTYPIQVNANNPTSDGCGGTQEINYDLQVFARPIADFNFTVNGCITNPVSFLDNSNTDGRQVTARYWDFGDATTSIANNPTHTYSTGGSYSVKYAVITDVGCLSDTAVHIVALSNPPTALFTASTPNCVNKPITFTDASTVPAGSTISKWYWDFGDATSIIATSNVSQTHTYAAAGTYTVTLKVETTSGCQSLVYSFPVIISINPIAGFNLPNVCLPAGAQFNDQSVGTIAAWAWDFGDAGTSTSQNPIHTYTTGGPYTVSLTVTSDKGCTDIKTQVLNTVYPEPQPAFTAPAEVCLGNTATFTDNSVATGSSVTSWAWNFGDATTSALQSPTHTYAAAGTYTVTLKVASAAGCQTINNTASHTILVKVLPTAGITGNTVVCLNAPSPSVTFTGFTGSVPFTFTYTINGGAPLTATTTSGNSVTVPVSTTTAGTFTYNLVSVQGGGTTLCSQAQTGTATVTVNALPTASITGAATVCLNSSSPNIVFTGTGGTAPYTFTYKINGGANQTITTTSGNTVSIPIPTTTAGTYTYTLVSVQEGSANLCNQGQTGSTIVTVNSLPTATISGTTEVCLNGTSPLITFTGAGGTAPYTFTYKINGGSNQTVTTTSGNSVTVPVPTITAGTFTYTLVSVQEGSASLCSQAQTGNAVVTVNPLPTGNFNFTIPSCETRTITFTDVSVANAGTINNWQWDFADPSSGTNTSTLQNPVHSFAGSGTYNVTLIATTDKGCVSAVVSKPVIINARPKAGFISPEICLTDPAAPFVDTSHIAAGTIVAWNWNFGDPNANAGNPNTSTLQNPTHRYTVVGPYTAKLIVTSNNGCKDTVTQTFTVNGSVPVAGFTIQNANTLCSNQAVNITDASTVDFGNLVRVEIYWDYTNNPTVKTTDNTPSMGELYSHAYPEFGTPFTKTYSVRYVAYSGINCVNSTTKTITVLATPALQFNTISPVCSDVPAFRVTQAQLLNGLPGAGVFTGTGITGAGLFNPAVSGSGTFTIRYTYTGTNTCINYVEKTIEVYQTPAVNAGPDKVVLEGGTVTLTPALNSGLSVTYLWTPPAGLNNPAVPGPVASPKDDITYTLTVTSDKGCTASDNVFVKVLKAPSIPNIFSPNGDGVHDTWVIGYLESYPGCTVEIYNRYGQLIFKSTGYSKPWDGTINGKDAPLGTYYYIIDPKNGRQKVAGYVDIIR